MDTLEKYEMIGGPPVEVWSKLIGSRMKQFRMSWYVFYFQMPFLPEFTNSLVDLRVFNIMEHETESDLEVYKYVFSQEGALTAPINYYRALVRNIFFDNPIPRPTTFVPGLMLLGESDKYVSHDCGELAQKLFDKLEFRIIKKANHFAQQHKPDETNRLIREFLEKK